MRAVRRWRDSDRLAINERRREAAALRPESLRARDVARATLAMALKRGKIERGSCAVCATLNVIAYQYDPARPLDVAWVCRSHRAEFIENTEQARRRASEHEAWLSRLERCDRELPLLPLELQAAIRETASRGPAGVRLSSAAPLYAIALVAAFERGASLR